jgi:hypothetical protein
MSTLSYSKSILISQDISKYAVVQVVYCPAIELT